MNHDQHDNEIVDLGSASVETQGPVGTVFEPSAIGKLAGITDE